MRNAFGCRRGGLRELRDSGRHVVLRDGTTSFNEKEHETTTSHRCRRSLRPNRQGTGTSKQRVDTGLGELLLPGYRFHYVCDSDRMELPRPSDLEEKLHRGGTRLGDRRSDRWRYRGDRANRIYRVRGEVGETPVRLIIACRPAPGLSNHFAVALILFHSKP